MDHLSAVDDLSEARAVPVEGDASSWTWGGSRVTVVNIYSSSPPRSSQQEAPPQPGTPRDNQAATEFCFFYKSVKIQITFDPSMFVKNRTPRSQMQLMNRNPDTPTDGGG